MNFLPLRCLFWAGLIFLISCLTLWPLIVNIKAINYNCYSAVDFSIYQQAIYDIWSTKDPNPFVSIRNVKIFNDHFDPILYLAVAFTALFGQGFQQLLIFEWLFFAGLLISIAYLFRSRLSEALPYLFCTVLTKLLLTSFLYPIHPSTWACLPLFWMTYFIVKNKKLPLALTVPLLCLFKESYAFALFPLGLYYAWKREFRLACSIVLSTLAFIIFELCFREKLLGPTVNYGNRILTPFVQDPVLFFKNMLIEFHAVSFIKMFYPFVACFAFYIKNLKGAHKNPLPFDRLFAVFLIFAPLLFLQIWHNKIDHHYGAQLGGVLIGLLVSLKMLSGLSKKTLVIIVGFFTLSCMGTYTKMFQAIFFDKFGKNKCSLTSGKVVQNEKIKNRVATISKNEIILSTGGIVPFILLPGKTIDHYKGYSARRQFYDYLILELNRSGDIYPATPEDVEGVLIRCRPLATEVHTDNNQLFFAKGNFENCVYPSQITESAEKVP